MALQCQLRGTYSNRWFDIVLFCTKMHCHTDENKSVLVSLERPLGFQEVEAPRISRQWAHEDGKVVNPTHRPSLLPGRIAGTHFC